MVVVRDSEGVLTESLLALTESKLGISLPTDYRDFLLSHNGGRPCPSGFRYKKASGPTGHSCVDWFLALYDGEYDNFETYFATYKQQRQRVPADLVPIAHDPGGNLICIATRGSQRGAVFFWDHELECEERDAHSYSNVSLIANTFTEFLQSLQDA